LKFPIDFYQRKRKDMTKTRIISLLISPLMLLLYGCQPDAPTQHAGSSAINSVSPAASQVTAATQPTTQTVPAAKSDATKPEPKPGVASSETGGRALAQKSGCFTCHVIDKKLVGPAWNDVANKYRGQKDAEAKLVAKVAKGGSGAWGSVPMPPNAPRVNENDIKTLVHFILSLK
jgi:cytochrome c